MSRATDARRRALRGNVREGAPAHAQGESPDRHRTANKRLGQHFLEAPWVNKVLRAIAPLSSDVFLEVGPGRGALTFPLAAGAGHVVAFEIDRAMVTELSAAAVPRLTIVPGDFLDVTVGHIRRELADAGLEGRRLRVAGNLPYNVASPILFKLVELFEAGLELVDATVMLQREVADRLTAACGTRDYGILSLLIGRHARIARLLELPPGAFRPPPKVRSALVRLEFHAAEPPANDPALFAALTQAIFTRRRKTLANALMAYPPARRHSIGAILAEAGIDGRRRPETLSLEDLVRVSNAVTPPQGRLSLPPRFELCYSLPANWYVRWAL